MLAMLKGFYSGLSMLFRGMIKLIVDLILNMSIANPLHLQVGYRPGHPVR